MFNDTLMTDFLLHRDYQSICMDQNYTFALDMKGKFMPSNGPFLPKENWNDSESLKKRTKNLIKRTFFLKEHD